MRVALWSVPIVLALALMACEPRDAEHVDDHGPGTKILGLTEVDISTSNPPHEDWGIFG